MNENNKQLLKQLIGLLPEDVHQFRRQLMSDQIIGEPIVHLLESLEDYVINEVILGLESIPKTSDNCLTEMSDKCEVVLDKMWETINCCDWSRVVIDFRHCFAFVSLIKALIEIWSSVPIEMNSENSFRQKLSAIKALDFGLLMSPKLTETNVLAKFAKIIHKSITDCKPITDKSYEKQNSIKRKFSENQFNSELEANKQKFSKSNEKFGNFVNDLNDNRSEPELQTITDFESNFYEIIPYFKNNIENRIKREKDLDLESFRDKYLKPKLPVVLTDCMNDWPAMSCRKWTVDYIRKVAAYRTVPIEIGSKYTDEDWTQKLMTINQFIDEYIEDVESGCAARRGYLAQHNLFDQIEELNADFSVPDMCSLTEEDSINVDMNAWFGPKATVSPLHYDPKDNLLAQVLGHKYIRLYSDETPSEAIYPTDCRLLFNTSQVDVENVDSVKFENFKKLNNYFECILKEGEMLYIPKNYWHFVKSLSTSFSLSFWWK